MKKNLLKIVAILVLTSMLVGINFALEVVVADFKGNVVYGSGDKWISVKKGQLLKEKEVIKTLSQSYALLMFPDGTNISLSENTELAIKELSNNIILNLNNGRVKSKVKPLQLGQKFEVHTPVSVASIRGTVFITGYIDGEAELIVEQGKVIWGDTKSIESSGEITNFVEVNELEKVSATTEGLGEKTVLTGEQLKSYDNFFELKIDVDSGSETETGKKEEVKEEEKKKEEVKQDLKQELKNELIALKQELKEFVREGKKDNFNINEIVQQTKSNDFETARSLVDVHGNLTRVEQTISRPTADTIEFVNITKRNSYVYKGEFGYGNLIENKPRVDLLTFTVQFNQNLPQKINDVPAFIVSKGEDFYPKKFKFELSNGKDKIVSDGTFTQIVEINKDGNKKTKLDGSVEQKIINAEGIIYKYDKDTTLSANYKERKSEDKNSLYFWEEIPVAVVDNNGNKNVLWLQSEGYLINNSGNILNEGFFNNSSLDPFSMLKQVAVESIVFVRKDDNGKPGAAFFNKNIDLVATPDIVIAMAKTFATSAGNLKFDNEK